MKLKTAEALNILRKYPIIFLSELNNKMEINIPIKNTKQINIKGRTDGTTGRPKGGMILIIRNDIYKQVHAITKSANWITVRFKQLHLGRNQALQPTIIFTYLSPQMTREELDKFSNYIATLVMANMPTIIIGDLNARIGELDNTSTLPITNENIQPKRQYKDKIVNKRGIWLQHNILIHNFTVLNGRTTNDKDGEFTCITLTGQSTNDIALADQNSLAIINDLQVLNVPLSDHMPLLVTLTTKMGESIEIQPSSHIAL